jgi:hypothetical protein
MVGRRCWDDETGQLKLHFTALCADAEQEAVRGIVAASNAQADRISALERKRREMEAELHALNEQLAGGGKTG